MLLKFLNAKHVRSDYFDFIFGVASFPNTVLKQSTLSSCYYQTHSLPHVLDFNQTHMQSGQPHGRAQAREK